MREDVFGRQEMVLSAQPIDYKDPSSGFFVKLTYAGRTYETTMSKDETRAISAEFNAVLDAMSAVVRRFATGYEAASDVPGLDTV